MNNKAREEGEKFNMKMYKICGERKKSYNEKTFQKLSSLHAEFNLIWIFLSDQQQRKFVGTTKLINIH
jgi:hypothetical protein